MKITINKREIEEAKVGDFLILQDEGEAPQIRQIVHIEDDYMGLDVVHGVNGFIGNSVEDVVATYKANYDSITLVKHSEVEIVIGGR